MADRDGIVYLRALREKTPVIYPPGEAFPIGGSRVLRRSDRDAVTLVAAGITVTEALAAADALAAGGTAARVIDAYSLEPLDAETIRTAARETGAVVTIEDHRPAGGLGDAVLDALADPGGGFPAFAKLAVRNLPGSATPAEQLRAAGIDADAIVAAARALEARCGAGRSPPAASTR
jgi:transketolase